MEDLPLSSLAAETVQKARQEAEKIIAKDDDRLLVIVGPCSIHDIEAAKEYATKLKQYADTVRDDLLIIMRVYFEKPRTTVGWKGLINDPFMDSTFKINSGLKIGRKLLLELNEMGLPAAVEFLDTLTPQYLADLVAWGAIGARTTESQVHRELASGLSCSVGFKNATDGNIKVAIDAIRASSSPHVFLSVTKQGLAAVVETTGNSSCHVILRGGNSGPNFDSESVLDCGKTMRAAGITPSLMVDCSHGNSQKQHRRQIAVAEDIVKQLSNESGEYIIGVMIESNLEEGRQNLEDKPLVYGKSITDACISWEDTVSVLDKLVVGVRERRLKRKQ